ncbi:DUF6318 family protein [Knoellia aerolata]|uniref:DUF6318 family protein n=1 Tax=Knoellia aerolata TaxID=442954 RepID=UPI001B80153B|nr:DUF6318 family protein [Knoellia aerolata]
MTYAVSAATVVTLALAGCNGGEEEPSASPTATSPSTPSVAASSASPSVTATPSPSTTASINIPAAARANTDAGAIAFVRFWFDRVNEAFMTPNPSLIPALSSPSCRSCSNLADNPVQYAAKGQRVKPAPFKPLRDVKSLGADSLGQYRVSFTLAQNAVSVVDSSGKVVESQKASSAVRIALLSRKGEQWVMQGLAAPQS